MSNTAFPERGSIDTARGAWSTQRHDDNASRREAIRAIVRSGVTTLGGIAKALQVQGVPTPSGATKWHRAQVARLLDREPTETAPTLPAAPADEHSSGHLNDNLGGTPFESVPIEITVDHVFLPTGEDGNVGPGWESAGETERVWQGRRLMAPRDLAESLQARRQAAILPPGSPIPVYFRPGQPRP